MDRLLLASSSPRRRDLLDSMGLAFSTLAPEVDESLRDALPPRERVLALAADKAHTASLRPEAAGFRWILAADTLVCIPSPTQARDAEVVLGKPRDITEARAMIRALSGRDHCVYTGLALFDCRTDRMECIRSDSHVRFASMDAGEIEEYLASEEWRGVAGAYRIQGRAALFIEAIEGSWSGIVGLPLRELYVILKKVGFDLGP